MKSNSLFTLQLYPEVPWNQNVLHDRSWPTWNSKSYGADMWSHVFKVGVLPPFFVFIQNIFIRVHIYCENIPALSGSEWKNLSTSVLTLMHWTHQCHLRQAHLYREDWPIERGFTSLKTSVKQVRTWRYVSREVINKQCWWKLLLNVMLHYCIAPKKVIYCIRYFLWKCFLF